MDIYFFQAKCGDAARVEFQGNDGKIHNVFIDSGFGDTYRHILKQMIEDVGKIDLWIISHIHDDHIGGILAFLNAVKAKLINQKVKTWWYNPPRLIAGAAKNVKSIHQGDRLFNYLKENNKLMLSPITSELKSIDLYGLKITVLSPDINGLNKLRAKYQKVSQLTLEHEEPFPIDYKALKKTDYDLKLIDFDPGKFDPDENIDNGSSIAVLTELDGKRILWLADAHSKVVIQTIKNMGYSKQRPIHCDLVKVTHHGSKGNNSAELYELVKCTKYIFSVNGDNIHKLPDKHCFASILINNGRDYKEEYQFYFTYDNATLKSIFDVDGKGVFEKFNFKVFYNNNKFIKIKI